MVSDTSFLPRSYHFIVAAWSAKDAESPHMKTNTLSLLFVLLLSYLSLSHTAQAVVPSPDGGYANFTTAEGSNALQNLTTGLGNTAAGWHSLFANSVGNLNTAIGAGTLLFSTGDSNTATGALALLSNTTGIGNTANGTFALRSNTTGFYNTATGQSALLNNNGTDNTGIGSAALTANTNGNQNTATGAGAMYTNMSGSLNTATGEWALFSNVAGNNNTATGAFALENNTGNNNTAVGAGVLFNTTTGNDNVALGRAAGGLQTTGTSNIFIGDVGGAGISNVIAIGNSPATGTSYNKCYVGAIYGKTTGSATTLPVIIDNLGQLGTAPSSARFKKEIKPMDRTSESVLALKPVTFQYKSDQAKTPQFGLVAEEVAAVNPDLVVRDSNGEIYSVRYDAVNAMLLNEFLKEHHQVQDLKGIVAKQQKQIEALTAGLNKVSAQLELSKPAPQTVRNTD
jgi:hypothetical protein